MAVSGNCIDQGGGFAALLGFMRFSRGAEEEADKLGVQYMYAAGYDPTAMATMFEKLEAKNKKKPGTISKLFSTHPAASDRRAAALSLASRFPGTRRVCNQFLGVPTGEGDPAEALQCADFNSWSASYGRRGWKANAEAKAANDGFTFNR